MSIRILAAAFAALIPAAASADYDFAIAEFKVQKSASTFVDNFDDGTPPESGQIFNPNAYTVRGTFESESNGLLRVNQTGNDNGFATTAPDGREVYVQMAVLNGQIQSGDTFTVSGLWRYDIPSMTQIYGMRVQDTTPFAMGNDTVSIDVGDDGFGNTVVRMHEFNFETGEVITVGRSLLNRSDIGWIGLALTNSGTGANTLVQASFVLYDLGMNVLDTRWVMSDADPSLRATSAIFDGENFTRAAFFAVEQHTAPIPEAETWALMLAGLGLVGVAARRRRA